MRPVSPFGDHPSPSFGEMLCALEAAEYRPPPPETDPPLTTMLGPPLPAPAIDWAALEAMVRRVVREEIVAALNPSPE